MYDIIHKLNPEAKIIPTNHSKVNIKEVVDTGMFDFEEAENSAGWIRELENEHVPETEEYGIGSFVFRTKKPFHPDRFLDYVQNKFPTNVIRSKGLFWLGSRSDQAIIWSTAGGSIKTDPAGVWCDSMPFSERITYASFAGLCIIATTLVGMYKFNQIPDLYTLIGLALILSLIHI